MQTRAWALTKPPTPYRCSIELEQCTPSMSARQRSSPVSTAADPPAAEPSPGSPASLAAAGEPGAEPGSLQGAASAAAAHSTAPASPSAPSSSGAGGGGSQWAAPHRAASDAGSVDSHVDSHQSWGTHVSHHSQRSRWSIAATVATTVAPRLAEPRLLDLEEGGSSGEGSRAASPAASHWRRGDAGGSSGAAAAATSPRSSRRSPRSRSNGRGSVDACVLSNSSRRLPTTDHPLDPAGSSGGTPFAAIGGMQTAESAAAAGKLPPRLVRVVGWMGGIELVWDQQCSAAGGHLSRSFLLPLTSRSR